MIEEESEGFEPPSPFGLPVFKTGVISHSTNFPLAEDEGLEPSHPEG